MNLDQAAAVLIGYAAELRALTEPPPGWEAFFAAFVQLRTEANRLQLHAAKPPPRVQVTHFAPPEQVHGSDGKTYPAYRLPQAERAELAGFVHARHHEGMSVRQIVAVLGAMEVCRSVGWVAGVLRDWRCPACVQEFQNGKPEQSTPDGAP